MDQLSVVRGGRFVLSSCDTAEVSLESPELGGVFTHYLCQGLTGAANNDGDGLITIAELYGYVAREVQAWSAGGAGAMTPTLAGKLSGNPVLAMLDVPDQTFNYVEPGGGSGEQVRQVTYNEAQQLQASEEQLVLAKLILFDSEEEASLNVEYRADLSLEQVRSAAQYCEQYLAEFPQSPEGYRYLAQARWFQVGLEVPRHEHERFAGELRDTALKPLDTAIGLEPDNPANYLLKSQISLDIEDYPAAEGRSAPECSSWTTAWSTAT
jgi:hypothetical protein